MVSSPALAGVSSARASPIKQVSREKWREGFKGYLQSGVGIVFFLVAQKLNHRG